MKRAAPPCFPFPYHRPLADWKGRLYAFKQGEQTIRRGWWPSTIAGYDIAGRKL